MEYALSAINHTFTFGLATFVLVSIILKDWVDQRRKLQAQEQKIIDAITGGGASTATTDPPPIPPKGKKINYQMKKGAQRYAVFDLNS